MRGWLKLLVLATVPILAVTMVVDTGLAADKGSQLIYQSNMAHHNFISVVNTSGDAVTVLVQYYNNDLEMAVWYLRVILGNTTVLVDPFNHMIPGSDPATNVGDAIMASGKAGNGHFVIAVTPVGTNAEGTPAGTDQETAPDQTQDAVANTAPTVNVLFPTFLAEDLHGTDNIDNGGVITSGVPDAPTGTDPTIVNNNLKYTKFTATDTQTEDNTSKNVGDLSVGNSQPIAFNHLTGHFTEALVGTDAGGSDQTASWGGTPIVRPAVTNRVNAGTRADYTSLNGMDTTDATGGQLAEKDAGGVEVNVHGDTGHTVSGYLNAGGNKGETDQADPPVATADQKIPNTRRDIRGLNMGALVLPALHGGGAETKQIMLLLSVADSFGDPNKGTYKLMPAMTGYRVTPMDQMGNPLDMKDAADAPVFGSGAESDDADTPSYDIIVNGISVMTNADLAKCTGTAIDGPWTLSHLTDLVPAASAGGKDFAGLDAMIDPMMNASPGWVKFGRMALTCEEDYGDGDGPALTGVEDADGVPVSDKRTYTGGTLIVQEKSNDDLAYVTTGRALLKFITSDSTFAASWTLKSPASGTDLAVEGRRSRPLGQVFSSKERLSLNEGRSTGRNEVGGAHCGLPLFLFSQSTLRSLGCPRRLACHPSKSTASFPINCGGGTDLRSRPRGLFIGPRH